MPEAGRRFVDDAAGQIRFEAEAGRNKLEFERKVSPGQLTYRVPILVPVHDDQREVEIVFGPKTPPRPVARINGPVCLRHRNPDGSLCMWFEADPVENKWELRDGLIELVNQVRIHSNCEAECRAGRPWPNQEAPKPHVRPKDCPACGGKGK